MENLAFVSILKYFPLDRLIALAHQEKFRFNSDTPNTGSSPKVTSTMNLLSRWLISSFKLLVKMEIAARTGGWCHVLRHLHEVNVNLIKVFCASMVSRHWQVYLLGAWEVGGGGKSRDLWNLSTGILIPLLLIGVIVGNSEPVSLGVKWGWKWYLSYEVVLRRELMFVPFHSLNCQTDHSSLCCSRNTLSKYLT